MTQIKKLTLDYSKWHSEENKKGPKRTPILYIISSEGCHICVSHACNGDGYPYVSVNGIRWRASRFAYTFAKGKIPKGKVIRHTCDNRKCINPLHLVLGTPRQNNIDRKVRGRNRDQNGSKNNMSRLSEREVIEIYNSKKSYKELSKLYNISFNRIWDIKGKRAWKSVLKNV